MNQERRKKASVKAWAETSGESSGHLHLPADVKLFKLKQTGNVKIDIIPYVVGKGNPHADEGMEHFERTFYIHSNLGPDGRETAVCNYKTFNKRCLFCEEMNRLRNNGVQWDDRKGLNFKMRHLFRVIDYANKDARIQVWETGHTKTFGEQLQHKISAVEEYENFSELSGGMSLILGVVEDSFNGNKYNKVGNIELVKRKFDYPESMLEEEPNLDQCIRPISDKDAMRLLSPGVEEDTTEDDDDAPPVRTKAKTRPPEDDETPSRTRAKSKPADDDDEDAPPVKSSKSRKPADDEDDDPPVKPAKAKAKPVDDDEDDDIPVKPTKGKSPSPPPDEDEDDDDMPPPPRGRR
jgi:hypothetical protein